MANTIHYLKVEKTAKIVSSGNPNPNLKQVWLVAHGYGHLANYFINKFETLNAPEHMVIVPEGLHRYYLNGFSGKVGASWMTKEEREKDINDYCNYLDKVYEAFIFPLGVKVIINAFGFSQGGATICRWVAKTKHVIDNIIMWGSVIPPDMIPIAMGKEEEEKKLKGYNWIYVAGSQDEFLNQEQQQEQLNLLAQYHIKPQTVFYEGGHDLNSETLHLLTQKCVKVAS